MLRERRRVAQQLVVTLPVSHFYPRRIHSAVTLLYGDRLTSETHVEGTRARGLAPPRRRSRSSLRRQARSAFFVWHAVRRSATLDTCRACGERVCSGPLVSGWWERAVRSALLTASRHAR